MLKERTYKSKEIGGYGYMCVVQPGKQEGAERSGQVSLQRSLAFLLFFTWSQQVCHPCHLFSDAKLFVNLTYKHGPDQMFIKQPSHVCQSGASWPVLGNRSDTLLSVLR